MAINSECILAKNVKIDKKNVTRNDASAMLTLLRSNNHLMAEKNDMMFIKEGVIDINVDYGTCMQCNYLAFQNPRYANKWFFGWIRKCEYLNDGTTEIEYEVDSWTTWYERFETKTCFVEREHVNDDTIGLHTIDENLDVGEIICDNIFRSEDMSTYGYIGIFTNYIPRSNE